MRKLVLCTLLLIGTIGVTITWAQESAAPVTLPNTEMFNLTATANGHDYQISVGLPAGYADAKPLPYPVLYLLDPDLTFGTVNDMAHLLAPDELPALIVVGIGNVDSSQRSQDYDSQDDKFLSFITGELIPYIDSHYRTVPSDRTLAGFSLGGQFVLYMLATKLDLFYRYVAISPSVPFEFGKVVAGTDEGFRANIQAGKVKLFIGSGSLENNQVANRLAAQHYDGLTLSSFVLENGTRRSALYPNLSQGILSVYCGTNDDPARCAVRVRQGQ